MILPIILLILSIIIVILFSIITIQTKDPSFLIIVFIFVLIGGGSIIFINDFRNPSNKEKPTREVDYSIILIPFDKVEITDKHGNRDTIQFESLQYFIEQDNK